MLAAPAGLGAAQASGGLVRPPTVSAIVSTGGGASGGCPRVPELCFRSSQQQAWAQTASPLFGASRRSRCAAGLRIGINKALQATV